MKRLLIRITYDNSVPQQDNLVESEVEEYATQLRMSLLNQVKGLSVTAHSFTPEDGDNESTQDLTDQEYGAVLDPGIFFAPGMSSGPRRFPCEPCQVNFDTERGLKIHNGRVHKNN